MKQEIKDSVLKHVKIKEIFVAIVAMFLISFVADMFARGVQNMYEKYSSPSVWVEYQSITPDPISGGSGFVQGERLAFLSKARYGGVDAKREDYPYCMQQGRKIKYRAQHRPSDGTEYKKEGDYETTREYLEPISTDATKCQMCGTTKVYTPLGYEKQVPYCVERFDVNL